MRKNFTQKFLTIFVFLSVYAFCFKAYAQPLPADCTNSNDQPGTIAVGAGTQGRDTICPGANAPLINGNQGNARSDSGSGQAGGPLVTFEWQYRNASTGGNFVTVVGSSVIESDPNNCNNPRNCSGTGPNFNPGFLSITTDFVRIRRTSSTTDPVGCFKASNIVTIYAQDFYKPFIVTGQNSIIRDQNAGVCGADVHYEPNTVTGTDNCTGTSGTAINDTLVRTYSRPSGSFFPIGLTRVIVTLTDVAGNSDTTGFNVTVRDTSKPVFTGPGNLLRFTEPQFCSANITASEFRPTFDDCTTGNNDGLRTLRYTIRDSSTGATVSSPMTGVNYIPDTTLRRGLHIITYYAEDSAGNFATEIDSVFVRDNIKPIVTAPADRRYGTATCGRTAASLLLETNPPNTPVGRGPRGTGGSVGLFRPTIAENCSPVRDTIVYGPNDTTRRFNTKSVGVTGVPDYDNTYFTIGTSRLIYVAVDSAGNRSDSTLATSKQTIVIIDTLAPKVFCATNDVTFSSNQTGVTIVPNTCTYRLPDFNGTYNDGATCDSINNRQYGPQAPMVTKGVKFVKYYYYQNGVAYDSATVQDPNRTGGGSFTMTRPFRIGVTSVRSVAFDTTGTSALPVVQGSTNPSGPTVSNGPVGANNISDTCSFNVTVIDNTAPFVRCKPFTLRLLADGTGTLTPANVTDSLGECNRRAGGVGFSLSRTQFSCSDIANSPVSVRLTFTDSAGNQGFCDALVTVVSNITPNATTGNSVCTNSGTITIAPTGGSGTYTFDITGPGDNSTGDADGTYDGLTAGSYVVRVTDANTTCTRDTTVVVGSGSKLTTDPSITTLPPAGGNSLPSVGSFTDITVILNERGGFDADSVAILIPKEDGYTLTMNAGMDASMYTFDSSNPFFYLIRKTAVNGVALACGSESRLSVRLTRNTPNTGNFSVTFTLLAPSEENRDYQYNNSASRQFIAR